MNEEHMSELDPRATITQQASYWWILLARENVTQADREAFLEWTLRGPERVEAFIQTARLTKALQSKRLNWPSTTVEELVREAQQAHSEVVPLIPAHGMKSGFTGRHVAAKRPFLLSAAAAVLLMVSAWVFVTSPHDYKTEIGEQRSVVLNDGSVVTLNTSSSVRVRITKTARVVQLLTGEALFQVAHDKARPFDVVAGNTTVRAVGTQFNVDLRADSTRVTVVEGKVAVKESVAPPGEASGAVGSIPLSAGEGVTVSQRERPRVAAADVSAATAWTRRRLVFEHRPLGEVADEFNRYNRQEIHIASAELRSQEVTGVFQANDPNPILDFVARIPGVSIERRPDIIVVMSAP
jgi:transmembrane sensor